MDEWYCESCGHRCKYALAAIEEKPNCVHWEKGFCKEGMDIFRNRPKCLHSMDTQENCGTRRTALEDLEERIIERLTE